FITDDDMDIIRKRGAGVAHCPLSNVYFSNAVFPLRRALEKGLHVGLGTDISGGPSASLLDSVRMSIAASRMMEDGVDAKSQAGERGTPDSRIDFRTAFWLATRGGGEALDLPVGCFTPGNQFDAILVRLPEEYHGDEECRANQFRVETDDGAVEHQQEVGKAVVFNAVGDRADTVINLYAKAQTPRACLRLHRVGWYPYHSSDD
ncbi:MAG: hypothetical protein EBY62_06255, partial [Cellvibrionales bacterium]|nr:hypothetical protein [Cellvibrionales bacterium]